MRSWDSTFNSEPAGSDAASTIDDKIRETRSEIYKRMITFFDNWVTDPDTPANLDVKDDVIKAEHIAGLTGTGNVDTDNIPEGSTNKYFNGKTLDDLSDGSTYRKVTGVNTSHQITANSIANDAITNAKIANDAVQAEHIAGLTGTGSVSLDNIPDGSSYVRLSKSSQTIYGDKTFNGKIIDKNGNEVIAMQIETKSVKSSHAGNGTKHTFTVDVTGFSFNPTAIMNFIIKYAVGTSDPGEANYTYDLMYNGGTWSENYMTFTNVSFGTNKVTFTLTCMDNVNSGYYVYFRIIVTAART